MSNERIDLTQFEELPEAPWGYGYWEYENTRLYEDEWENDKIPDRIRGQRWWIVCPTDGQGHLRPGNDGTGFVNPDMVMIPCDEPTFSEGIDRRPAIVDAVNALPEILAELKRCYDLIDAQKENLEFLNGAIEKLHEETWTEAVGEFVEEHHPSEWCDYAGCWRCEEETTSE